MMSPLEFLIGSQIPQAPSQTSVLQRLLEAGMRPGPFGRLPINTYRKPPPKNPDTEEGPDRPLPVRPAHWSMLFPAGDVA